jgi:Mg-chelatase subunit ChlD
MDAHVTFVLDSSGSMSSIREDTIGGFNTFLTDQRAEDGSATVSLVDFNSTVDIVYRGMAIEGADELSTETYTPGGQTALYDAITTAIADTTDFLGGIDSEDRPDTVIVVVLTDGKENASETPQDVVRERIEDKQTEHDWQFLFIGANQDAALTAEGMGIDSQNSLDMAHSGDGAQAAYESTSNQISEARRTGQTSGYNEEDRQRQEDLF